MSAATFQRGQAGEALFTAECLMRGFGISTSSEGMSYDMVVDNGKQLHRVQVKTVCAPPLPSGAYSVNTRTGMPSKQRPYTKDDCDYLAVHIVSENQWWIIPIEECGTTKISINPQSAKWREFRGNWKQLEP